ncbi:MAG: isoprenylcysteine carboxylmethyltransferase family protein [Betaproteobacteria bacterium]
MRSIALVALQFALIAAVALPWNAPRWNVAATVLVAAAISLGLWALSANRPGNFNIRPEPKPSGHLVTGGPYRFVRHPMYLAVLLFGAGCCVGYAAPWRWLVFVALGLVLHAKARIEEAAMPALHPDYNAYVQRTRRIVPFVW